MTVNMNQIMETNFQINLAKKQWPACAGVENAAAIFGWPVYYII
jgi:hypothetical protein